MIGAAVLATGLLLILAGLAAPLHPPLDVEERGGRLAFARRPNPIRSALLSPIDPATWYANGAILIGPVVALGAAGIVVSAMSAGLSTLLAGIGLLFVAFGIEASRLAARLERWRAFVGRTRRPPAHPYRPLQGGLAGILRAEFADESRWRDVLYVAVNVPLALVEFLVVAAAWTIALSLLTSPLWHDLAPDAGVAPLLGPLAGHDAPTVLLRAASGLALLPIAASLSQLVIALHRAVVEGLLCTSESRALRRQVEALRESRSAVLDVEANELHRIERDLHDGAQQRLVMLTIELGRASERVETDPAAAKRLILEGQEQARLALAEIRDLVRGIAPSILLDRGLVPALESIAGRGPVPTAVISTLGPGERFPAPVERTAYFVGAEALANVAKHSRAARCEVRVSRDATQLAVEVWDDGRGGARLVPGSGLAGLASRVAGVDGRFSVSSPAGGPTLVRAEMPLGGRTEPAGEPAQPGAAAPPPFPDHPDDPSVRVG